LRRITTVGWRDLGILTPGKVEPTIEFVQKKETAKTTQTPAASSKTEKPHGQDPSFENGWQMVFPASETAKNPPYWEKEGVRMAVVASKSQYLKPSEIRALDNISERDHIILEGVKRLFEGTIEEVSKETLQKRKEYFARKKYYLDHANKHLGTWEKRKLEFAKQQNIFMANLKRSRSYRKHDK